MCLAHKYNIIRDFRQPDWGHICHDIKAISLTNHAGYETVDSKTEDKDVNLTFSYKCI
jgi:hypothetical protein